MTSRLRFLGTSSIVTLLIIVLGIVSQATGTHRVNTEVEKRTFFTNKMLINKVYPDPIMKIKMIEGSPCRSRCKKMMECFAFAYSAFARMCHIYKHTPGMQPLVYNSYMLNILERSEADGYYKFGSNYIKLFLERLSSDEAQKVCKGMMNGMVVAVVDEKLNELLARIMAEKALFVARIGLTDEVQEGHWMYYDDEPARYFNWHYKGTWENKEKNCAMITANKQWKQIGCNDKLPFFCQIPFF